MASAGNRPFLSIVYVTAIKGLGSVISLLTAVGIANFFGAGTATDAYFLARRVTSNLGIGLERAFHLLQVPPLVQFARMHGIPALRDRLSRASALVLLISLAVTIPAFVWAAPVVGLLAPGFDQTQLPEAVFYFRILLLTVPISAVTALSGATMNALRRFSLPVLARLAPRGAVLLALMLVPLGFGFSAIAVAVVAGTALMGLIFAIALRRVFRDPGTVVQADANQGQEGAFSRARIAAMLIAQAHVLGASWIDLAFASTAGDGNVAAYDFAQRLVNMTPGLVTNSVMLVYYTEFANALTDRDVEGFRRLIRDSLRLSLFFVLPICVGLALLAGPLVAAVLQHGSFSAEDAKRTAGVVAVLALLLPVNAALGSIVSAIFADSRLPHLRMILVSTGLAIAARVLFDWWAVPRYGLIGVPVGVLLAMTLLFLSLYFWLSSHLGALLHRDEVAPFLGLAAAGLGCGAVVWLLREALIHAGSGRFALLSAMALTAVAGALTFLLIAGLCGLPEARQMTRRLLRPLSRGKRP
ncbi:MAG: lipid II flippase MurJ [Paracoccaceae bacterium]